MERRVYPVVLTEEENCILVDVPDLGILTEGENLADAVRMARDAIGLKGMSMEDHEEEIPRASLLSEVDMKKSAFYQEGVSSLAIVDIDFDEYRRKNDTRTVRRNVTLPIWLNNEAKAAKINVSSVLQEALMSKLNVLR